MTSFNLASKPEQDMKITTALLFFHNNPYLCETRDREQYEVLVPAFELGGPGG